MAMSHSDVIKALERRLEWEKARRKEAERLAEDLTRDLFMSKQKAEAALKFKDVLMMNISHEFRTPLHQIIGMSEVLIQHFSATERIDDPDLIFEINKSGTRLNELFNRLLELSNLESGTVEVNLETIEVEEICELLNSRVRTAVQRSGLKFRPASCSLDEQIRCDYAMIQKIFDELADNAVKHLTCSKPDCEISCFVATCDNGITFGVQNPIAEENVLSDEKVLQMFNPFVRHNASMSQQAYGLGLGLALANKRAALFGGRLLLTNSLSEGFVVRLLVPQRVSNAHFLDKEIDAALHPTKLRMLKVAS